MKYPIWIMQNGSWPQFFELKIRCKNLHCFNTISLNLGKKSPGKRIEQYEKSWGDLADSGAFGQRDTRNVNLLGGHVEEYSSRHHIYYLRLLT